MVEKNNDPVDRFGRYLTERSLATEAKLKKLLPAVLREMKKIAPGPSLRPCRIPTGRLRVFDNNIVPAALRPVFLKN